MRIATYALLFLALAARDGFSQVGGNVAYGQASGRARAEQNERARRQVAREETPGSDTAMFVDAAVLMNVKADEFVATFGVVQEAETVEACQTKMDAAVGAFIESLKRLGVAKEAIYVDFTAQTKVYKYKVEGNLAREQLAGFELKKTVAVRYRDKTLLDRMLVAASRNQIYDLIKVDYVVADLAPIQEKLAEAAAAVVKAKSDRHARLLGVKLRSVPQIYVERTSTYAPTEMYDSYAAAETEAISNAFDRSQTTIQSLRKSRTFYYNPLQGDGFDRVIDPVVLEPVVQFTYYLKLKYEIETRR